MTDINKFEAIKYRHEDQAKLLQYITKMDLQFLSGFFTLQLALVDSQVR